MAGNSLQDPHIGMLQFPTTSLSVSDVKMNVMKFVSDHLQEDDRAMICR